MADELEADVLSADEQAFFESGGETEIKAPEAETEQVEQEQTAEQVAEPDKPTERDDKGRFVPHQALHAEREEHKKTKATLEEISRKQAVLEDRWNTILQAGKSQHQETEQPPDPEQDIFAYSKWQAKQLEALNQKVSERERMETETQRATAEDAAIWSEWNSSAQQIMAEKPDFGDATKFLSEVREKQLASMAAFVPSLSTPQGRVQQINAELKQIIVSAKQAGITPAQAVYEMATAWGFQGKAPPAQNTDEAAIQVAALEAAQKAAKTISGSGGASGADPLTPEAVANMSPGEFDAWISKPENTRRFNQMMGG